jgi:hypothetical protein
LILSYATVKLAIHFDLVTVEIIYLIFGMLYSFSFLAPISILLTVMYSTDAALTKELFKNKNKLLNIIVELKSNLTNDKISEFQKVSKYFNADFYRLYWDYFKHYKKRVKTSSIPLTDYYINFEKILNLVSLNAEVHSNKTKELLNDFSKYLDDVEKKILLQILDRNIQIRDVKNFIECWTKHFKQNYKRKYQESSKYLDEHIKIQREKYRNRSQRISRIIETIAGSVIILLIALLVKFFTGISLF